jgi:hypothetical protein
MKSAWFKLFFCAILVVAVMGGIRWVTAAVRRSHSSL